VASKIHEKMNPADNSDTKTKVEVSVIIVNWNSKDYLRQCLNSLYRFCTATPLEIIVVDGASYDGCGEMLAKEFPSVMFIQSDTNLGFAKANNLGARQAVGEYLLLLNPDTEFIENTISVMISALVTMPNAGAIGCSLLNADRSVQTSCVQSFPTPVNQALDSEFLRKLFPQSSLWGTAPLHSKSDRPIPAEAISGACILVSRKLFETVKGFTEDYFMYGEDMDLCFKFTRAGHPSYYVSNTSLIHYGGGSSGQSISDFSNVMMRVSVHRFIETHRGSASAFVYRMSLSISALIRLVLIYPTLMFGNRVVSHGKNSVRKWSAILRWSVGFTPEIAKPRAKTPVPASRIVANTD
jgi:GT2 family glycosyltransferase